MVAEGRRVLKAVKVTLRPDFQANTRTRSFIQKPRYWKEVVRKSKYT
jgi:hypothetical protein